MNNMNKTKIISLLGVAAMTTTIVAPTATPTGQTSKNTKPSDNNSLHNDTNSSNQKSNPSDLNDTSNQEPSNVNQNISNNIAQQKSSNNENETTQKNTNTKNDNNKGENNTTAKNDGKNDNNANANIKAGSNDLNQNKNDSINRSKDLKNQIPKAVQLNMTANTPIEQASLNVNNVWEQPIGNISFNSKTMKLDVSTSWAETNPYASSTEPLFRISLINLEGMVAKSVTFNGANRNPEALLSEFSNLPFQYGDKLVVTYINKSAKINVTGLNENGTISSSAYNVAKTTAFNIEKTGLSIFNSGKLDVNPLPIEGASNIVKTSTVTGTTTPESEVTVLVGGKTFTTQANYVGTFAVPVTDENGLTAETAITVCVPGQVPVTVYPTGVPNLGINKASIVTNANCHLTSETLNFNPTTFKMNVSESGTNQFSANLISDGVPVAKSETSYFNGFSGGSDINNASFKYGDILSLYQSNESEILWGNTTINTGTNSSTLNTGQFEYYRVEPTGLVPVENKNLTINNPSYGGQSSIDISGETQANVNVKISVGNYTTTVRSDSKGQYVAKVPASDMNVGDVISVYVNGDNFGQIIYNYSPSYALYSSKIQVSNYYGQPIFNIGFNPADSKFTAAKNITYYNYSGGQETGNTVGTFYTNRLTFKLINSKTGEVKDTFSTNQLNDSSAFINEINGKSFENGDILEVSYAPSLLNVSVSNGTSSIGNSTSSNQYFEITNAGLVDISNKFIPVNPVDILGSGATSTNITGTVKANENVMVTIGDKMFSGTASSNGNFSIPVTLPNGFNENTNIVVTADGYIPTTAKLEYGSKVSIQNSFINFYSQGSTSNIQSSIGFDPTNMKFTVQNYVDSLGNGSANYFTLGLYNQDGTAVINPTGINNGSTAAISNLLNGKSFKYGDVISLAYNPSLSIPVALNNQSVIANITGNTEYFEITKNGLVRVNFGEKIYTQKVSWNDNNLVMNLAPSMGNNLSLTNGKVEILNSSNKVITSSTMSNGSVEFTENQLKNLSNQSDYKFMVDISGKTLPIYVDSNIFSSANYKLFTNASGELEIEINHISYPISNANDIASYSKTLSTSVIDVIKNNDAMNSTLGNAKAMGDVIANAFINRFGVENLQSFYNENSNNAAFINWVLNNDVAMSEYLQATNIGPANINSLQIWSDIWNEYTNSHSGFNLKLAIATAIANETTIYDCFNGDAVGSPVVRYNIFETLNEQGGMVKGFDTLNVKLLEAVVDVPITNSQIDEMRSLLLQNHNNLVTSNDLSGTDYTINYTFRNPYNGASIFGSWEKFYGPNATVADVFKIGGVCGSISRLGSVACRVFGEPSHQMGEPGHDAFYSYDIQNGQWYSEYGETTVANATGFDVSGWSNGLALNSYIVTYNAIYAAANNAQLTKSNKYLWMANSELSYSLKLQAINNAIQAQPLNVEAWLAKINLLNSNSNTTAQDYINLSNELMSALKDYPEPMFDLLVKFNKHLLQVGTTTQYNDFVNTVTSTLKSMAANGDSSQQTQANRVLNDGYMTQYGFTLNQAKVLGQININSWQRSQPTMSMNFSDDKISATGINTWVGDIGNTGLKINLFDSNMNGIGSFNAGGEECGSTLANSINGKTFTNGEIIELEYTPGDRNHGYLSFENANLVTQKVPNLVAFQVTSSGLKILNGPYTAPNGKKYNFYSGFKNTAKGVQYWIFGTPQKGMQTIDRKQYYFNNEGIMQTGLQTINNYGYYFNKDGVMQTGWQTINNQRYYFGGNGEANPGYQTVDGKQYLFANNGLEIQNAIPNSDMKISSYSTEENNSTYSANNIIDGNINNNWQNSWSRTDANPYVTIELNNVYTLNDLICFPRQDGGWNGNILKYKILVSLNGKDFTPVTEGNWVYSYSSQSQFTNLNGVKAKYIKIESEEGISNLATIAEVVLSGNLVNSTSGSKTINKDVLIADISKASAILNNKAAYTTSSLQALIKAVQNGEIVNKNSASTQSQVTTAENEITNAIKNLQVNKVSLVNEIKVAKAKLENKAEYSASTVTALNNELANAVNVNNNANATVSEVANAVQALENSVAGLRANKTVLTQEINEAKGYESNPNSYSKNSLEALGSAISSAEKVMENANATPQEVSQAQTSLENAIKGLEVNKTGLETEINKANEILKAPEGYTPESVKALQNISSEASKVLENPNATPEEVKTAGTNLINAIKNLQVNKASLVNEIKVAKAKLENKAEYSASTVTALNNEVANAVSVNNNANATVSEVINAVQALENSVTGLRANKTALIQEINEAKGYESNPNSYSKNSIETLGSAISSAEKVMENANATPEEVSQAQTSLENAIKGLEVNKTGLESEINKANEILKTPEGYTPESVKALQNISSEASKVLENPNATPEEVKTVGTNLINAIKNLQVNKASLVNEIKVAKAKLENKAEYSAATITALNNELANAVNVNNNANATVSEVANAVQALENSVASLKPNKEILTETIDNADKVLGTANGYTKNSVEALNEAILNAQKVLVNPEATATQISNAINDINNAIKGLKANKEELNQVINEAEKIFANANEYTMQSIQNLSNFVIAGQQVMNNKNATPAEIRVAVVSILSGIDGLEVNNQGLNGAIKAGEAKLELQNEYTSQSIKTLNEAILTGEKIASEANRTPKMVEEAQQAIEVAIKELAKAPSDSDPKNKGIEGNNPAAGGSHTSTGDGSKTGTTPSGTEGSNPAAAGGSHTSTGDGSKTGTTPSGTEGSNPAAGGSHISTGDGSKTGTTPSGTEGSNPAAGGSHTSTGDGSKTGTTPSGTEGSNPTAGGSHISTGDGSKTGTTPSGTEGSNPAAAGGSHTSTGDGSKTGTTPSGTEGSNPTAGGSHTSTGDGSKTGTTPSGTEGSNPTGSISTDGGIISNNGSITNDANQIWNTSNNGVNQNDNNPNKITKLSITRLNGTTTSGIQNSTDKISEKQQSVNDGTNKENIDSSKNKNNVQNTNNKSNNIKNTDANTNDNVEKDVSYGILGAILAALAAGGVYFGVKKRKKDDE
ncbi:MAG: hypothetical protein ACRCYE_00750 [Sarcina sp.]